MKTCSIWFVFQLSTTDTIYFSSHAGGRLQATAMSAQEISADKFEQTEPILELRWVDSTTNSRKHRRIQRVFIVAGRGACSQYQLSKVQEEKRHDEVAKTLTLLRPQAVSTRCSLGSFRCSSADPLSAGRLTGIFRRVWGRLKLRKLGRISQRKKPRSCCAPRSSLNIY